MAAENGWAGKIIKKDARFNYQASSIGRTAAGKPDNIRATTLKPARKMWQRRNKDIKGIK